MKKLYLLIVIIFTISCNNNPARFIVEDKNKIKKDNPKLPYTTDEYVIELKRIKLDNPLRIIAPNKLNQFVIANKGVQFNYIRLIGNKEEFSSPVKEEEIRRAYHNGTLYIHFADSNSFSYGDDTKSRGGSGLLKDEKELIFMIKAKNIPPLLNLVKKFVKTGNDRTRNDPDSFSPNLLSIWNENDKDSDYSKNEFPLGSSLGSIEMYFKLNRSFGYAKEEYVGSNIKYYEGEAALNAKYALYVKDPKSKSRDLINLLKFNHRETYEIENVSEEYIFSFAIYNPYGAYYIGSPLFNEKIFDEGENWQINLEKLSSLDNILKLINS